MLSVQKHQTPSDTPAEGSGPATATGFAKVLNSIQGLQQRLDDFSVEEVSRAHAKTHTLIGEINDLQAQLDALAKLKDAVVSINAHIAAIPEDNFDPVGPDGLEKHPQLRAIVQAGKLIRMHRILKAAQASAEPSFGGRSSVPNSDTPVPTETASNFSSPTGEQISQLSEAQTPLATAAGAKHGITPEVDQPPAFEKPPLAHGSKGTPTYDFADLKLEETQEPVKRRKDDSAQAAPRHQGTPSRKSKKAKGKPQINERLLSDLIETYGEFAISTKPPAREEAIEIAPPAVQQLVSTSTDLVLFESTPAEPAFVKPTASSQSLLGLPAPEQGREEPVFDGPSPSVKSQGEIDRQLKSIIKDYGEVDLYSHQKTLNVKTAVIAAVVGLAVVIGGFYLFKAPSAPTPVAVEAITPDENSAAEVNKRPTSAKQDLKK